MYNLDSEQEMKRWLGNLLLLLGGEHWPVVQTGNGRDCVMRRVSKKGSERERGNGRWKTGMYGMA